MRLSRFVLSVLVVAASPGLAQVPPLQLPPGSPKATVTQKVGLIFAMVGKKLGVMNESMFSVIFLQGQSKY